MQEQTPSRRPGAADTDWLLGWGEDNESSKAPPPARQPHRQATAAPSPRREPELAQGVAERQRVRVLDPLSEEAISNICDMQLLFFGTSAGQPALGRWAAFLLYRPG